ncbi:MAG TPA: PilW family protein, partial [Burkholderiaceae bacterium]|nr:PilW family protein [Burkholderiaceae bacterium]
AGATASTGIHPATLTVDGSGQPIPIEGFEPTAYPTPPFTSATAPSGWTAPTGAPSYWGGDILQLQIASGAPVRVTNMDTTNGNLTIVAPTASTGNFNSSNYALLANCSAAAVFQVQSASTASGFSTLGYAPASGTVPVLTSTGQFSLALDTYPTVQHYDQVTYYLGRSPSGLPALYRYSLSSNTTEELVENIEDMDVVYGVGTHGVNVPSAITGFMKANAMTATDFSNVISVRVSVIAVGDQRGAAPTAQTLMFHGTDTNATTPTAWTATDTRLRQVFTATVALRDRVN